MSTEHSLRQSLSAIIHDIIYKKLILGKLLFEVTMVDHNSTTNTCRGVFPLKELRRGLTKEFDIDLKPNGKLRLTMYAVNFGKIGISISCYIFLSPNRINPAMNDVTHSV